MRRGRFLLCAAALAVLAGRGRGDEPAKGKPRIDKKGLAVLESASRVEVFRIKPRRDKDAAKQIGGYPILATGKDQGKEFAAGLTKVLKDEKTWNGMAARCFNPGVAFRVHGEKGSVDVIVCFACTNFAFTVNDSDGKPAFKSSGAFGPRVGPLLKLAKKAFPDDKEIQGLKEGGGKE